LQTPLTLANLGEHEPDRVLDSLELFREFVEALLDCPLPLRLKKIPDFNTCDLDIFARRSDGGNCSPCSQRWYCRRETPIATTVRRI
jgi:hypothetical protein